MAALRFHNPELESLQLSPVSRQADLGVLERTQGATHSRSLSGKRPLPASAGGAAAASGYSSVWLRDNVYVAERMTPTKSVRRWERVK